MPCKPVQSYSFEYNFFISFPRVALRGKIYSLQSNSLVLLQPVLRAHFILHSVSNIGQVGSDFVVDINQHLLFWVTIPHLLLDHGLHDFTFILDPAPCWVVFPLLALTGSLAEEFSELLLLLLLLEFSLEGCACTALN